MDSKYSDCLDADWIMARCELELHYMGIVLRRLAPMERTVLKKLLEAAPHLLKHVYTAIIVLIGWTIFRVEDLNMLSGTLGKMFGIGGSFKISSIFYSDFTLICSLPFIVLGVIFMTPLLKKVFLKLEKRYAIFIPIKYLLYLAIFGLSIVLLIGNSYNPFIYFRF